MTDDETIEMANRLLDEGHVEALEIEDMYIDEEEYRRCIMLLEQEPYSGHYDF